LCAPRCRTAITRNRFFARQKPSLDDEGGQAVLPDGSLRQQAQELDALTANHAPQIEARALKKETTSASKNRIGQAEKERLICRKKQTQYVPAVQGRAAIPPEAAAS